MALEVIEGRESKWADIHGKVAPSFRDMHLTPLLAASIGLVRA